MRIKFWGVRGSIPVPGKETVVFGGNTTCMEITTSDKQNVIIDAGTGIRVLGQEMLKGPFGVGKGKAHIFFTHSHWDHIQGFPFFTPAYVGKKNEKGEKIAEECNEFILYGAAEVGDRLENTLRGQMDNYYFPVDLNYLSAKISFKSLIENQISIGNAHFTAAELIHPSGVLGYRIEDKGKTITIATDCEHPSDGSIDENLLKLAKNADVLVYDGQYTPQEYAPHKFDIKQSGKQGFGHSTPHEGARIAKAAGVKRLVITHHDPLHTDEFLTKLEKEVRELFPATDFAKEGMEIEL